MTKENINIELLNEIRDWLAVKHGLETYYTTDDRVAYAVLFAYNAYIIEDNAYKTSKEFLKDVLSAIPYKVDYSALERSIYRNLKKVFDDEYTDVKKSCIHLAKQFKEQKAV